jgi:hypothetical protein
LKIHADIFFSEVILKEPGNNQVAIAWQNWQTIIRKNQTTANNNGNTKIELILKKANDC